MKRPWPSTLSVSRITKKTKLHDLVAVRGWQRIGEPEWNTIATAIPGIAPEELQVLDIAVDAPWFGVRQHSLDELEACLRAIGEVYSSKENLRRFCRATVIRAKDRARWATRNPRVEQAKRRMKAEMVQWMLVWLGDPALFPAWVAIRRSKLSATGAGQ
jgi:hypothetical protein